nr:hypothetical protein [Methylomarinum sp. Ch1-1]MDP4521377.1 hypothetical protein [Methylomarinum sp. Ch1-1]
MSRVDQAQRIRQKLPPEAKLAIVHIQADCLSANPPYGGRPDGYDTNVGWIKCSGSTNVGRLRVGWLREASHHNPHRGAN